MSEFHTKRCTGHCCKRFALEFSYTEIQEDYTLWRKDRSQSKIPQVEIIAPMLIPLRANPKHSEYLYTCKNLDKDGNCTIYEKRPQMCRDFPMKDVGCHFWKCTSDQSVYSGASLFQKIRIRWNWLKRLKSN